MCYGHPLASPVARGPPSLLPRVRSELRYNGPKPNVREAGLVMLADAVESALRNRSKEQMIDLSEIEIVTSQVISETVASGQLDHCPLSLADLFAISGGFVEVLAKQFPDVIEQQNVRYIDDFKSRQEIGKGLGHDHFISKKAPWHRERR